MGPKQPVATSHELFRQPLSEMVNSKHPLVKLADVIDWEEIERSFGAHFESSTGRPALPPRLVAGLLYLQHACDCSDEAIPLATTQCLKVALGTEGARLRIDWSSIE